MILNYLHQLTLKDILENKFQLIPINQNLVDEVFQEKKKINFF